MKQRIRDPRKHLLRKMERADGIETIYTSLIKKINNGVSMREAIRSVVYSLHHLNTCKETSFLLPV